MVDELDIGVDTFTRQSRLFELLDPPGRLAIMRAAKRHTYEPDQAIVTEGAESDAIYILSSGSVCISVDALEGPKNVARLGPGAVFGEMGLVTNSPRTATVWAEKEVVAWRIDKLDIDAILVDYPRVRELLARLGLKRSEMNLEKMLESDSVIEPQDDGDNLL